MLSQVAPTVCVDRLQFARCSFANVDHSLFQRFLRRFSELQAVKISDSAMDGVPVSDAALRQCVALGITDLHISDSFPEVRNTPITDQAIVDFLFQKTDKKVKLTVQDPSITREFAVEIFKVHLTMYKCRPYVAE
ncbi:hypothetical protein AAVH_05822 [Aphelenchoides avenae]|nr:hypothetical protein AAVH_05822 [Aphelenchus avenae]